MKKTSKLNLVSQEIWLSTSDIDIAKLTGLRRHTVYQFRKHNDIPPGPLLRHSNKYKNGGRKKIIDIDYVYALIYKNGIPKGSQVWKKAVRSYYGLACVSCGYQKKEIINHCHHRIPTSKGGLNTVRNGIVLCSRCHDEEHAGLLKIPSLEINYNL